MPVHADVRHPASGRMSSAQSSNVSGTPTASMATSAPSPSVIHDRCNRVDGAVVDRHVRAEVPSLLEPRVRDVEDDDPPGSEQLRGHHRSEADRAGSDDRDGVTRLDSAGEHADLVRGREDVGKEDHVLVGQPFRDLVDGCVRKGNRASSAWRPSMRWPKIQPPPPVQRP